jgi:hypothetical protein
MKYTLEALNAIITSDGGLLVGELPKLHKEARIHFTCKCGKTHDKSFRYLKVSGMLCADCTMTSRKQKCEKTNLERYNTTCTLQAESIKKKAEETCLKRHGAKNPFLSESVKEKIKKTNVEKYGAENPFGSEALKQKLRNTCKTKYGTEFPMQNKDVAAKTKATNMDKYGVPVSSQAECVKEKARQTNMEVYGCEHHSIPEVLGKAKITNMDKYGVEHTFQAECVKEKIKETMMDRYGVEHNMQSTMFKEKAIETNLAKYGVSYPLQSKDIQEKAYSTNIERYGVKHVTQSPEIQEKSQKKGLRFKEYLMPSGEMRKVQGYEPFALNMLLKEFAESDIITSRKEVPRINYTTSDNVEHYYFPDIWIKSINKLIEVKSTWTYQLHKETNALKWEASKKAGYMIECWAFDAKGVCATYTL